jgi:8-oxo-dGTP diphosphatase
MLPANAPYCARWHCRSNTDHRCGNVGDDEMLMRIERRLASGLRLIQVRDKALPRRADFARSAVATSAWIRSEGAREWRRTSGSRAGADGVHWSAVRLGQAAERPQGLLCGASCHTVAELERAAALDCDFAVLGPVRETATHARSDPLGWQAFARFARGTPMPVFAIGGLRPGDLDDARSHGAHGLAMIRGSWS